MKHERVLKAFCGLSFLHAHCYQAAQQNFYEACKTAKALKPSNSLARYPYKRTCYHTTTWKNTGSTIVDGRMRLALARGVEEGSAPQPTTHTGVMAVARGKIHPAACTKGAKVTSLPVGRCGRMPRIAIRRRRSCKR